MENASQALLLGAGILIGLIIISIGVYLFSSYSGNVTSYDNRMQETEIKKFNVNFTKFEGRDNITIQEIVTLINFAEQYEKEYGIHITISVGTIPDIINYINAEDTTTLENKKIELIEKYEEDTFECKNQSIERRKYDKEGKIIYIKFNKKS